MNESTFSLLKNTTRGKIINIDRIPPCSKELLLDAVENVTKVDEIIEINRAIQKLIAFEYSSNA
ncbi:hypothetical protein L4D20_12120 [Vibrio kyushuensis]|uniref:hypothetical protein n=1 Tax=Vibrio kyushuensis TaxID=2910249 RepID=UPI003D142C2A